jgi:uncharacterized protein
VPAAPTARVNDYAGLLAPADRERLETRLAERERATGAQVVVAIFPALEGENLEDFSIRLAQRWRIGRKGLDDGVVLLVFVRDRRARLEVGYGLEAALPDAEAGRIIAEVLAPRFRAGRYADGLTAAAEAVHARITPGRPRAPDAREARERLDREAGRWRRRQAEAEARASLYVWLFVGLVALVLGGMAWEASRWRGGYTSLRRGGRTGGWHAGGGGWGGGWSGGWSGGGDGGFSGGGGSFGGGGASGSW